MLTEEKLENKLAALFCHVRNKSLLCIKLKAYVSKTSQARQKHIEKSVHPRKRKGRFFFIFWIVVEKIE